MKTPKWTQARREMLLQLRRKPGPYASYYPPLKWALEQGYAVCRKGRYGDTYEITQLGRRALVDAGEGI